MSSRVWQLKPELKLDVNDAAQRIDKDAITTDIYLIENAVSRLHLTANNREGRLYLRSIRNFDTVNAYLRYSGYDWKQVFGGKVEKVGPALSPTQGHVLSMVAYGYGRATRNTHCIVDYGSESENPTIDNPSEIVDDLRTNRINKSVDGGNTGYNILGGKIMTMNNPSIDFVKGGLRKNIDILNEVLLLYQAYRAGSAGAHWRVDPNRYLWVDAIGAHTVDLTNWPTYWKHNAAESLLLQKRDIKSAIFNNSAQGYANRILLCTDVRKPGYDSIFTEGHASDWGAETAFGVPPWTVGFSDDNTIEIVGTYCLKADHDDKTGVRMGFYPATEDAGWDLSKWGSPRHPPRLCFYFLKHAEMNITSLRMFTTDRDTDYYELDVSGILWFDDPDDVWVFHSIPIGEYHANVINSQEPLWVGDNGNPDWTNINGIALQSTSLGAGDYYALDDMFFLGKIIRDAYDSGEISANQEHQKVVHMEVSVSDSLKASDDSGTAARLAYAELLHCLTTPLTGVVTIPIVPKIMEGQLVPIKFDHVAGSKYRIDDTFRIIQVHHHFGMVPVTNLTVTDDLINTFAVGPGEQLSALKKALFADPEAKSMKTAGIDTLVGRLSKDYA